MYSILPFVFSGPIGEQKCNAGDQEEKSLGRLTHTSRRTGSFSGRVFDENAFLCMRVFHLILLVAHHGEVYSGCCGFLALLKSGVPALVAIMKNLRSIGLGGTGASAEGQGKQVRGSSTARALSSLFLRPWRPSFMISRLFFPLILHMGAMVVDALTSVSLACHGYFDCYHELRTDCLLSMWLSPWAFIDLMRFFSGLVLRSGCNIPI